MIERDCLALTVAALEVSGPMLITVTHDRSWPNPGFQVGEMLRRRNLRELISEIDPI